MIERLARRIAELYATDAQFAAARPDNAVSAAIEQPGLRLPQVVQTVMEGYADRPALGQRAVELVTDPQTGRTSAHLLPRFDTITYREVWDRAGAIATALAGDPVRPGDRVCVLGFASVDYTTVDVALMRLGAVVIPLQTSAPAAQLRPIVTETQPAVIASGIDYLADAVELVQTGYAPKRLLVFDYRPQVDDQREAFDVAMDTLAGSKVIVETLAEVLDRGKALPPAPSVVSDEPDPLMVLFYTSGSTGTPKGAMYSERLVANAWRKSTRTTWGQDNAAPSIVLNFMPMSHIVGQHILFVTLANGGTVYFTANTDLSTLLDDLALVRPTELTFVPRIWEMLFQEFQSQLHRRASDGADPAALEAEVMAGLRQNLLGGRFVSATTASAPISAEMTAWVESLLDMHLVNLYGSTEDNAVIVDTRVQRPPVIDYKLVDAPELGYFHTDRPHPRGELLVKSETLIPGYYKRPDVTAEVFDADGYYHTGDIFAEIGPDRLVYVDRRSFVLKLSQGEFVTLSKLEAVFAQSPLVRQIYVYGNGTRAYLLAVVVPTQEALSRWRPGALKPLISESLQNVANAAGLRPYEIPRDFIVETTPFSLENGLLTGIGKLARPKLKEHYGPRLEQLYADLAAAQVDELRVLGEQAADRPVIETLTRAVRAVLGATDIGLDPEAHFTDLGGDSLSALTLSNLLRDVLDVEVPVGVIVSPASNLRHLAEYVADQRFWGSQRPTFATVHGESATEIRARELTLDKFIDAATLADAPTLPRVTREPSTVLLTGANGWLGRFLCLQWLDRLSQMGGRLICVVRGSDAEAAQARLWAAFDSGDPGLSRRFHELAANHLEVLAGDVGEPNLGLHADTWQRLADTVDLIVHPAALVNHVLPYDQLFGPNVVGTAEIIRMAVTTRIKPVTYVSTVGVSEGVSGFTEDGDIRALSPVRSIADTYANGYSNSKWAGEVLLRQAHDLCGLPVVVFRCDMILAHTRYTGQLNVADMFSRLLLSLLTTGIAPRSFYETDAAGNRPRAHYDGLPVDFIAEAITTLGGQSTEGFRSFDVLNPHDDGVSLDVFVDWLIDGGHDITRIDLHDHWLARFETALMALPEKGRTQSVLPLLDAYRKPEKPINGAMAPAGVFHAAVRQAKISADNDIPHITSALINKYPSDLRHLGLLEGGGHGDR